MFLGVALVTVLLSPALASDEGPIVQLSEGYIRGRLLNDYSAFQGIPYAAPPLDDFRFKEPQPVKSWDDVLNTNKDPNACVAYTTLNASEDCLYLNVYTPGLGKHNYPVMVFIHGGSFSSGSADKDTYGPDYLVREGEVVLVVIQYRLGPFGFLTTGDDIVPGNLGLKDQNYALQWVQKNIHLFGGNPNMVTVFGQSAGAASVGLHLISEKSKGLFRAAICQSGSALNPWTVDPDPKKFAYELANVLDGTFSSSRNSTVELKEVLMKSNTAMIAFAADGLHTLENRQAWPVLEPEGYKNAFLSKPHFDLVGKVSQVPLMIGDTSDEFLLFYNTVQKLQAVGASYDAKPTSLLPQNFKGKPNTTATQLAKQIKNIYLNDSEAFADNLDKVLLLSSDENFVRGNIQSALLHSLSSPVYFYEFSHEGRVSGNFTKIPGAGIVPHAAELPFVFNFESFKNDVNHANVQTQRKITKLWSNFAKYLNPTPEKDDLLENIIWPRVNKCNFTILNINDTLSLKKDYKKEIFSHWRNFFFENGVQPFVTF